MKQWMAMLAVTLAGGLTTLPAHAEFDVAAAKTCLIEAQTKRGDPGVCIETAHAACLADTSAAPAVSAACFAEARDDWGKAISAEMEDFKGKASEQIATVAGIELKYDLILALTQCDRMEELAGVSDAAVEVIQREKARCMASASGFAFARLLWRAATLPPKE